MPTIRIAYRDNNRTPAVNCVKAEGRAILGNLPVCAVNKFNLVSSVYLPHS
jgi:hypothetical protein